jgi:hypothetical protein
MKKCRNCGNPLRATKKRYCPYCGAAVSEPVARSAPAPAASPLRTMESTGYRPLLVVGLVVVVLFVLTSIILAGNNNGGQSNSGAGSSADSGGDLSIEPTTTTTTEDPTTPTTDDTADPATVVRNFYAAVNRQDYVTAWQLGGMNLGQSYSSFAQGYATTVSSDVTVVSTSGDVVDVVLTAQWTDGTTHEYTGTYTVENGQIVNGKLYKG